jgi:hypothetical protein
MKIIFKNYKYLAWWIANEGWIELGLRNGDTPLIYIIGNQELVYEDEIGDNLDKCLKEANKFMKKYIIHELGLDMTE